MDAFALLQELVALPGPPGQEDRVREAVAAHVRALDLPCRIDAKGNLLVPLGDSPNPRVVVTAHLDEIAMIVRAIEPDGRLVVASIGGLRPWKLGEGPVTVLATAGDLPGVLSFGGVHTEDPSSTVRQADAHPLTWDMARVVTGLAAEELGRLGVRPGTRVVVAPCRRTVTRLGEWVASYFLDDRADLVAWLLALEALKDEPMDALFAATTSEEVGGEGALYLMHAIRPEVCVALELGPHVPDAPVALTADPTVWAIDGYAAARPADLDRLADLGAELGMSLTFQALSRGGSDASCAASHGLCARPITFGIPVENGHGYEIMHREAPVSLARLTVGLLRHLMHG
ncbi:MAG: hypothetical protein KIS66_04575 [Fimbriimonadaceae bacterium]|nr:hypothetical protein [Fimbriimonadaceae bacterium]